MKKRRAGFTIIELLVYSGILVAFLYVMTNIFTSIIDLQLESESTSAVSQDSRYILARFNYDIGRASAITQPSALGGQSSTLILQIGPTAYTYTAVNGSLLLTDAMGTESLNSYGTSVPTITFRRYGNVNGKNSVSIDFTLVSTTQQKSGPQSEDFQATIGLR